MSVLSAEDGRGLRRRVIAELQRSESLWREYRQRQPRWWRLDIRTQRFLAFFLLVVVPVAIADLADPASLAQGPRRLPTLLVLAVCGRAFTLAVEIWAVLFNNAEFGATSCLPIRPEHYFGYQIQKILFRSLWVPLLAAVSCLVLVRGSDGALLLIFPVAMLNWVVLFALSLFIVRYGRTYLGLNSLPGYAFYAIAALTVRTQHRPDEALSQFQQLFLFLPPAWIDAGFQFAATGERSMALMMLLPSIALAASVAWNYAWLKQTFLSAVATALPAFPEPEATAEDPEGEAQDIGEDRTAWTRARAELQGLQAAQSIERGVLAARIDWASCGPIERCAGWWFNERERTVAEFLLGEYVGVWSQRWKHAAIVAAVVVAGGFAGFLPPPMLLLGAILSMIIGCPMTGGFWLAFKSGPSTGLHIPMLALFPVGFREISGVVVKSGALRLAAWLPLGLLSGMAVGYAAVGDPEFGIVLTMYAVYAVLAFQPMAVAIRFAEGVSRSPGLFTGSLTLAFLPANLGRWMCSVVTLSIAGAFVLTAVALIGVVMFSVAEIVRVGLALTLPVWSLLFWRWYAFLFHHGPLDQVTAPKR